MSEEEKRTLDFTKKYLEDNTGKYKFTNEDLIVLVNLIKKQQKEIEELKQDYQILKDDMEGHRVAYIDTPEFEEKFISKDKIKEHIEFYKRYGKIRNSDEYIMGVEIVVLEELLRGENE